MIRRLTLRAPNRCGELLWDDETGTFTGTDAAEVAGSAWVPQWHPHFPSVDTLPARDPRALIVLLHVFGWDVPPELSDVAAQWLRGEPPLDPKAVY